MEGQALGMTIKGIFLATTVKITRRHLLDHLWKRTTRQLVAQQEEAQKDLIGRVRWEVVGYLLLILNRGRQILGYLHRKLCKNFIGSRTRWTRSATLSPSHFTSWCSSYAPRMNNFMDVSYILLTPPSSIVSKERRVRWSWLTKKAS